MKTLFIQYPKCSTCKKALQYLMAHGVEVQNRHIVEETPTKEELQEWIKLSGLDFKKFFNTSGLVYREMGLKDKVKNMTLEEATSLLASNGMLIKRPLLITDECVCVGYKEADYERAIGRL